MLAVIVKKNLILLDSNVINMNNTANNECKSKQYGVFECCEIHLKFKTIILYYKYCIEKDLFNGCCLYDISIFFKSINFFFYKVLT